jgi:outer membrane protein assembly factor BamB
VILLCVGTDGKEKWRETMSKTGKARTRSDATSDASASCSCDDKHVWSFVGGLQGGRLACHDHGGHLVWEKNLQDYGKFSIQFGSHWTPVLYKDRLYVTVLHREAQLVLAFDKATGKEIWKVTRTSDSPRGVESPDVYASPFIWEKGDKALLLVHGNDYCTAHDLADGHEVWRVVELNPKAKYLRTWRAVSSPLATPDLIVIPSCKHIVTVGIKPELAKGEIAPGNPAEAWRLKETPDVASPLLVDDLVYLMGENGILFCIEAATGTKLYDERITNMRHRANPVYADGKIYLAGRDGVVVVVKPGREFKKLAENKIPDTLYGSPAVADGRIYLRGYDTLWAIGAK